MITNLVAAIVVALVTNVTERFPTHQEPAWPDVTPAVNHYTLEAVYWTRQVPDANPSVKWVRTTVKRVEKWQWEGETLRTKEEIVSDVEVEHKRLEAWSPVATNDVPKQAYLWEGGISYATNYASTNLFLRMTNEVVWVTFTNGASK